MNEIKIPYLFVIPIILSLVLLLTIFLLRKKIIKNNLQKLFWISFSFFLLIYILIVSSALYDDIYCQWDLNRYDLNKDGFFGGSEITKDQEAAMQRLISDTGRTFSIFTGLIFSGLISSLLFLVGFGVEKFKRLKKEEK